MKDRAFKDYDIVRLYAQVLGDNIASQRVLEKNGFELEGVLKKHQFLRGKIYDEYIYATFPGY